MIFWFSITEDLGHRLSKVFFYAKKSSPTAPLAFTRIPKLVRENMENARIGNGWEDDAGDNLYILVAGAARTE